MRRPSDLRRAGALRTEPRWEVREWLVWFMTRPLSAGFPGGFSGRVPAPEPTTLTLRLPHTLGILVGLDETRTMGLTGYWEWTSGHRRAQVSISAPENLLDLTENYEKDGYALAFPPLPTTLTLRLPSVASTEALVQEPETTDVLFDWVMSHASPPRSL